MELKMPKIKLGIVPTTMHLTHIPPEQAEFNAKFAFTVSYTCAIGDGGMSAYGIFQILEILTNNWTPLVIFAYILISLVVAAGAILGIRFARLRTSSYPSTINAIRESKSIQGDLAQTAPEAAVIEATNNTANRVHLASWIYEIGSNVWALGVMCWVSLSPLFLNALHAPHQQIMKALGTLLFIAGISWLIPWLGHIGESIGYYFKECAAIGRMQEHRVTKMLLKP